MLGSGESAHWLLDRNKLALDGAARARGRGGRSLDVQYFVWQSDASGHLLADRMLHAADRGVRVRILVDDFGVSGHGRRRLEARRASRTSRCAPSTRGVTRGNRLRHGGGVPDACLRVEPAHAQQDVHRRRPIRGAGRPQHRRSLLRPLRAVRAERSRRHGRGPGGARRRGRRSTTTGTASTRSRSTSFACDRARGIRLATTQGGAAREHRGRARRKLAAFTLEPTDWSGYLEELVATFAPARSEVLWESPDILDEARPRLYDDFKELVASARSEVLISSPYFIPDAEFRGLLRDLVARGVRVVVVTNSLETNNHVVAHTGYRRWRREVLAAGVELYELRVRCRGAVAVRHAASDDRAPRAAHEGRRRRPRTRASSARRTSIRARWC